MSAGFYLGGGGYLFGKPVIDRLLAYQVEGPHEHANQFINEAFMKDLSLFNIAAPLSAAVCPSCLIMQSGNKMGDLNIRADSQVRMVDLCVNLMADERTCYHSDHSVTMCLIHGVYAKPQHVDCGGSNLGGVRFSMCSSDNVHCDTNVRLTCHHFRAKQNHTQVPILAYFEHGVAQN